MNKCSNLAFFRRTIIGDLLRDSQVVPVQVPVAHSGDLGNIPHDYWLLPLPCIAFPTPLLLLSGITLQVNNLHPSFYPRLCFFFGGWGQNPN